MGVKVDAGPVGEIGPLQYRLAHFIDDPVAARKGIAHNVEHAGAGPVQKVTAETVTATAMPGIGRLERGKVSGRYAQVRHAGATLAAIGVGITGARIKITG